MGALDCVPNSKMMGSTEVITVSMSSNSTLNEPMVHQNAVRTSFEGIKRIASMSRKMSLKINQRRDLESQGTRELSPTRRTLWLLLVDLPIFLIVVILVALFELEVLPSHKAGFFCNDSALSFQYTGDTVTTSMLVTILLIAPLITFYVTEFLMDNLDFTFGARSVTALKRTLWLTRSYVYGLIFNVIVIEVMKGITGSPRPTFFAICQPDTALTCNGSEYVKYFDCTSTTFSRWMVKDSYHSFPSGHTSFSVYCGVFLAWYLQKRAFDWRHRTIFLVPGLQLLCITFSAFASLTRITDRRHHWWDVLVGFFVGIIAFLYAAVILCKNFSQKYDQKDIPTAQPSLKTLVFESRTPEPASP